MPLSSCDDDRLSLAQKAKDKLEEARALMKSGDYAQALECYLFAFDNSLAVSGWGGVRLSFIPADIARLGVDYPPAVTALETRRDAREALIRAGETDYDLVAEWTAINRYLHAQDRELALLNELEKSGTLSDSLKETILRENFDRLLEQKKYKLLSEYFNEFGRKLFMWIAVYENDRIFHAPSKLADSKLDQSKKRIAETGAKVFELALGLGHTEQADGVVKQVLKYDDSVGAYRLLINAAERTGKKRKTTELRKLANERHPAFESSNVADQNSGDELDRDFMLLKALEVSFAEYKMFQPIDVLLSQDNGIKVYIIADFEGKVLIEQSPPDFDSQAFALVASRVFRTSQSAVNKIAGNQLQIIVMRLNKGFALVFKLNIAMLILFGDGDGDELFALFRQ